MGGKVRKILGFRPPSEAIFHNFLADTRIGIRCFSRFLGGQKKVHDSPMPLPRIRKKKYLEMHSQRYTADFSWISQWHTLRVSVSQMSFLGSILNEQSFHSVFNAF